MLLISCTSCKRKKYTLSADKFAQNAILLQFHVNFFFFEKTLDKTKIMWYYINVADRKQHKGYGEVSERFKELVLKTSDSSRSREFESRPLRHTFLHPCRTQYCFGSPFGVVLKWWRGAPAKGVGRATGARVQISPTPPQNPRNTLQMTVLCGFCFLCYKLK